MTETLAFPELENEDNAAPSVTKMRGYAATCRFLGEILTNTNDISVIASIRAILTAHAKALEHLAHAVRVETCVDKKHAGYYTGNPVYGLDDIAMSDEYYEAVEALVDAVLLRERADMRLSEGCDVDETKRDDSHE